MVNKFYNNFNILRVIFALLVVVSHCFDLHKNGGVDILLRYTKNQIIFSNLGLNGFFILSGYLIMLSILRTNSMLEYFKKRILRIYPGLFFVLLFTIILVLLIEGSKMFFNPYFYSYIFRNLSLFYLQFSIPPFLESNHYKSVINGSLWTLAYEFLFYILFSFFIYFKDSRKVIGGILLFLFIVFMIFHNTLPEYIMDYNKAGIEIRQFLNLGNFFIGGAIIAIYNSSLSKLFLNKKFLVLIFIILLLTISSGFYNQSKHIVYTFFILSIGLNYSKVLNKFQDVIGDNSYGIYIYSFLIQQLLIYFFDLSFMIFLFLSVILSFIIGYCSWHTIEKPFLKFKN
jgi:peptidoglycan/LPS O-acetylase OafA/YrhL